MITALSSPILLEKAVRRRMKTAGIWQQRQLLWSIGNFFASLDLFSFPWWKYRISKPSQGMDGMFQAAYSPRRNLSVYFNYRYRQKERDVPETGGKVTLPVYHHKFRCRLYLYCRKVLCAVLRSITTIFASKMGKGMNSRETRLAV